MRIVRFLDDSGEDRIGSAAIGSSHAMLLRGSIAAGFRPTGGHARIARLLAPVVPTAILGVGCNYHALATRIGAKPTPYPVTFFKLGNTVQDPEGPIMIPSGLPTEQVDYEAELAVVIGRTCKDVAERDALSAVFGYTVANDVSSKEFQREAVGNQWCKGKGFDTFCPLGPAIVTADELPDPQALRVIGRLNGVTVQDSPTADMIHAVRRIIAFLSAGQTLPAGAVILTGTPLGVGGTQTPPRYLRPGDRFEAEIPGIGTLANPVVMQPATTGRA